MTHDGEASTRTYFFGRPESLSNEAVSEFSIQLWEKLTGKTWTGERVFKEDDGDDGVPTEP